MAFWEAASWLWRECTGLTGSVLTAEDPKLAEFLQVMQPRHKTAIWANSDLPTVQQGPAAQSAASSKRQSRTVVAADLDATANDVSVSDGLQQSQHWAPAEHAAVEQGESAGLGCLIA